MGTSIQLAKPKTPVETAAPTTAGASTSDDGYVKDGSVCDKAPGGTDCFLTKDQRSRAVLQLTENVNLAATSYLSALVSIQGELAFEKKGWGVGTELLLAALSSTVVFSVEAAATILAAKLLARAAWEGKILASSIEGISVKAVSGIKALAASGLGAGKAALAARFTSLGPDEAEKATMIEALKGRATGYWKDISDEVKGGTDAELMIGLHGTDPKIINYESFRAAIEDLYARYKSQHLEKVQTGRVQGQDRGGTEVVRLTAGKRSRLALVILEKDISMQTSGHGSDRYFLNGRREFVSWIDSEFEDAAIDTQHSKVGEMKEIDVSDPASHPFRDPTYSVEEWAQRAKGLP
jgi:hypothetical protein